MSGEHRNNYKRVILKLSGEVFKGIQPYGINPSVVNKVAKDILEIHSIDTEVNR